MASTTPFKFKKEKTYVDEDTFEGVIKKRFKTEKKPTKFTWEGVRNLLTTLSMTKGSISGQSDGIFSTTSA